MFTVIKRAGNKQFNKKCTNFKCFLYGLVLMVEENESFSIYAEFNELQSKWQFLSGMRDYKKHNCSDISF